MPAGFGAIEVLAAVQAALQAVQLWVSVRDSARSARTLQEVYERERRRSEVASQAQALSASVPADVLQVLTDRLYDCWTMYKGVLEGGYLPSEIDAATEDVKKCICRELRRIRSLGGGLPAGILQSWWNQYCEGHP